MNLVGTHDGGAPVRSYLKVIEKKKKDQRKRPSNPLSRIARNCMEGGSRWDVPN